VPIQAKLRNLYAETLLFSVFLVLKNAKNILGWLGECLSLSSTLRYVMYIVLGKSPKMRNLLLNFRVFAGLLVWIIAEVILKYFGQSLPII
jgi:hypothetical protein